MGNADNIDVNLFIEGLNEGLIEGLIEGINGVLNGILSGILSGILNLMQQRTNNINHTEKSFLNLVRLRLVF